MAPLPSDAGTEGARGAHSAYPLLLAPTFFFTFRHHCSANTMSSLKLQISNNWTCWKRRGRLTSSGNTTGRSLKRFRQFAIAWGRSENRGRPGAAAGISTAWCRYRKCAQNRLAIVCAHIEEGLEVRWTTVWTSPIDGKTHWRFFVHPLTWPPTPRPDWDAAVWEAWGHRVLARWWGRRPNWSCLKTRPCLRNEVPRGRELLVGGRRCRKSDVLQILCHGQVPPHRKSRSSDRHRSPRWQIVRTRVHGSDVFAVTSWDRVHSRFPLNWRGRSCSADRCWSRRCHCRRISSLFNLPACRGVVRRRR